MSRLLTAAAIVAVILLAGWFGFQYFFGSRTRLTTLAPVIPNFNRVIHTRLLRPAHVVIVVEENKSYAKIIGNPSAPYINHLAKTGASFTHAVGVAHPSQPNYLALFVGLTNNDADACPERSVPPTQPSLGGELIKAKLSFAGYSEGLPHAGFTGCGSDSDEGYARKHAPWVNFLDVPSASNLPLTSLPALDALPTISFIVPALEHDMHSGSIGTADAWLRQHVDPIVVWAAAHDSLVVLVWDESDTLYGNSIPLVVVGARVKPGVYHEHVDHYRILRTLEDFYRLPYLGLSANVAPIGDIWR